MSLFKTVKKIFFFILFLMFWPYVLLWWLFNKIFYPQDQKAQQTKENAK